MPNNKVNYTRKKDKERFEKESHHGSGSTTLYGRLLNEGDDVNAPRDRSYSCHIARDRFYDLDQVNDISPIRDRAISFHATRRSTTEVVCNKSRDKERENGMPINDTKVKQHLKVSLNEGREMSNSSDDEVSHTEDEGLRRTRSFKERPVRESGGLRRVRSFKTTSKGLVNRGDSYKSNINTEKSSKNVKAEIFTPNVLAASKLTASNNKEQLNWYRVMLIGTERVGKSCIINQFMTSEFLGCEDFNVSQSDSDRTVTLQVDGEESTLEFLQSEDFQEEDEGFQIDAFVVVYCITERETFDIAIDLMKQIREEVGKHKAIILVGNKSDLVRKRTISQEEGRSAADSYGSKYIELSAALNHKVDELLVGIHKQIMLKHDAETPTEDVDQKVLKQKERKSSFKRTKRFLEKVFLGHSGKDKKTENLYVD